MLSGIKECSMNLAMVLFGLNYKLRETNIKYPFHKFSVFLFKLCAPWHTMTTDIYIFKSMSKTDRCAPEQTKKLC